SRGRIRCIPASALFLLGQLTVLVVRTNLGGVAILAMVWAALLHANSDVHQVGAACCFAVRTEFRLLMLSVVIYTRHRFFPFFGGVTLVLRPENTPIYSRSISPPLASLSRMTAR